jgi:hypothetical protein
MASLNQDWDEWIIAGSWLCMQSKLARLNLQHSRYHLLVVLAHRDTFQTLCDLNDIWPFLLSRDIVLQRISHCNALKASFDCQQWGIL